MLYGCKIGILQTELRMIWLIRISYKDHKNDLVWEMTPYLRQSFRVLWKVDVSGVSERNHDQNIKEWTVFQVGDLLKDRPWYSTFTILLSPFSSPLRRLVLGSGSESGRHQLSVDNKLHIVADIYYSAHFLHVHIHIYTICPSSVIFMSWVFSLR